MTNNTTRQELEKLKEEKETEIKTLEFKIKNAKFELSEINRRIFRLINSEFPAVTAHSKIPPINKR